MINGILKLGVLFPLIVFYFCIGSAYAQNDELKLVKNSNGISVYKQKKAQDQLDRIVARTEVSSNYLDVICLIKDFEHHQDWIYSSYGAAIIDSIDDKHWIYYGISETPWPFLDREIVTQVNVEVLQKDHKVIIHSFAIPDHIPVSPDMVRIQTLDSKWIITKNGENSTLVELDMVMDAGGSVPRWLIKLFAASGPYNTFKNMKSELEKHKEINYKCSLMAWLNE